MISVFYDGKCGVCNREIEYYKRIAPSAVFEWIDITINSQSFIALGFSVKDGLRLLHVKDANQKMHIGADAFIIIWQQIPWWRILAILVNFPLIKPIANKVYRCFADWRFKHLGYNNL